MLNNLQIHQLVRKLIQLPMSLDGDDLVKPEVPLHSRSWEEFCRLNLWRTLLQIRLQGRLMFHHLSQ